MKAVHRQTERLMDIFTPSQMVRVDDKARNAGGRVVA